MTTPRRRVELWAGPLVVLLARLPKIVPFLVVMGLLVTGLLLEGLAGAVLLGVVGLLAAQLLLLSWPALEPPARVLRTAVVALVLVRAVTFAF